MHNHQDSIVLVFTKVVERSVGANASTPRNWSVLHHISADLRSSRKVSSFAYVTLLYWVRFTGKSVGHHKAIDT